MILQFGTGNFQSARLPDLFLDHQLAAIALHHDTKVAVRLQPSLDDYRARFGKEASLLSALLR